MILKKLINFLFTLGLVLLFLGCSQTKSEPVKLGMLRVEDNLPFFAAQQDNIYENNGINIKLIPFNSARERDIALEAGEIQGELADLLAAVLLKKGGTPVKIVSLGLGVTPQEGRFAILSAPESGITSPDQLLDVPIAVSQYTIIHYLADEMLKEVGLEPDKIKLQNIPDMKIRFDALMNGKEVKTALLPDPLATLAENSGAKIIIDDTKLNANLSQTVIIFREEILEQQPEVIKKLMQSYQEAAVRLNNNPDKYKALIIEKARIPQPLENTYHIPKFSPLKLPSKEMVERVMTWMTNKHILDKPYSYEEMIAPGYL